MHRMRYSGAAYASPIEFFDSWCRICEASTSRLVYPCQFYGRDNTGRDVEHLTKSNARVSRAVSWPIAVTSDPHSCLYRCFVFSFRYGQPWNGWCMIGLCLRKY